LVRVLAIFDAELDGQETTPVVQSRLFSFVSDPSSLGATIQDTASLHCSMLEVDYCPVARRD